MVVCWRGGRARVDLGLGFLLWEIGGIGRFRGGGLLGDFFWLSSIGDVLALALGRYVAARVLLENMGSAWDFARTTVIRMRPFAGAVSITLYEYIGESVLGRKAAEIGSR